MWGVFKAQTGAGNQSVIRTDRGGAARRERPAERGKRTSEKAIDDKKITKTTDSARKRRDFSSAKR